MSTSNNSKRNDNNSFFYETGNRPYNQLVLGSWAYNSLRTTPMTIDDFIEMVGFLNEIFTWILAVEI